MKAMGRFISTLIVIDTFLASYYFGFHSRSVPVIDPSMKPLAPPVVKQEEPKKEVPVKPAEKAAATKPAATKHSAKPKAATNTKPKPKPAVKEKPSQ